MASSTANKVFVARAAAVLTASEVAATPFDVNNAWGAQLSVQIDFTLGSLTNVVVKHYASMDGVTYFPIAGMADDTITATGSKLYLVNHIAGVKWYRPSVTGTGTVTGSSATLQVRYLKRGSQS